MLSFKSFEIGLHTLKFCRNRSDGNVPTIKKQINLKPELRHKLGCSSPLEYLWIITAITP